jgi:hypothetical protein
VIFKSTIGTGITGALRYVQGPGRDENGIPKQGVRSRLLGGQGFGALNPQTDYQAEIARRLMEQNGRFEMQGSPTKQCVKDCMHISLSWARGQTPDDAEKLEASREFLKALGMEKSMALTYEHTDKSYAHIHIVASRLDPQTGLAYDDYQRMYKGMHRAIEWEREKNQVTKSRQYCHDLADATRGQVDNDRLLELLSKNEATIPKNCIDRALAFGGKLGNELEAGREAFVKHHDLVRLKKYQAGRTAAYTTKDIWHEESRTLSTARRLKELVGYNVDQVTLDRFSNELTLTDEQKKAVWHTTRDNGLSIISGQAGTGKSRTIQAVRKAYEQQGYRVRGLAFTNKVVQNLQRDGFDSSTIASALGKLRHDKVSPWNEKTVIMVDEAAQLSTNDLDQVLFHAHKNKSKVILAGHDRQLGAIEKGGLFPVMEKRFGSAQLTEVMRTKDPEQKRAYNKMAERKFAHAVEIFRKSGSVRWNDTKAQAMEALTDLYTEDFQAMPDATRLIVAPTNDEVFELNQFVRGLRNGQLGKEAQVDTAKGPRKFAVGDRIAMNETPNQKDKAKGLINGAFGWVTNIDELPNGKQQMTMKLDRPKGQQERVFKFTVGLDKDNGDVAGIDHGYASTIYKAQGDTLDRTYVLHNPQATRPSNYVALTRHIDRTAIFASHEETSCYEELARQLKHGTEKTSAHAYMVHEGDREKLDRHVPKKTEHKPIFAQEQKQDPEHKHSILDRIFEKGFVPEMVKSVGRHIERGMTR